MFRLHFESTEQNLDNIQFKFTLLVNNNPIAQTDPVRYSGNLPQGEDGLVTANAGINITGNQLNVGDVVEIHIEYFVTGEGLRIKYDSPIYDSGMELQTNAIKIKEIRAEQKRITSIYSEAFGVNNQKLLFMSFVDEIPIESEPDMGSSKDGRFVAWGVKLKHGTHIITVQISYGSNANESMVSLQQEVRIIVIEPPTFLGLEINTWFLIIILIILLAVIWGVVKKWRSRREEAMLLEMMER
jgi:hypothetical protein